MGRRSTHTPDQLRELIVSAATDLISDRGLLELSAREIARKVGYSPGTIYNVFRDLDELIYLIEARLLDDLALRIEGLPREPDPERRIAGLANAYLAFSLDKPKLWNLLVEHVPASRKAVPKELEGRIDVILAAIERLVEPIFDGADRTKGRRMASVLWAGLHGITTMVAAQKLMRPNSEQAAALIADFVGVFLAGCNVDEERRSAGAVAKPRRKVVSK